MGIFEKLYQTILNNRLYNFVKIPSQQSAYQKGKGCQLHVMTIRLLKSLTKKTRTKLYITFTDFEAAFDLVSRRLLFKKLIGIGISSIMLTVLMSIYLASKSVIEHKGDFSDYLILLTGIKQGAPTSGLLYIIYTSGLIDIFNREFNAEPLIGLLHMLMHADDILMLASTKQKAREKLLRLIKYSKENFIKLQLTKCAIMCVNSKDPDDYKALIVDDITLKNVDKETYLGSVITNSHKIAIDVKEDIKHRSFNIIKFYAFLRENSHAPIHIKIKVLNSCIIASILHNCETWANTNIQQLEVKYRRMLKCILGVKQSTCSELLFVELSIFPIGIQIMMKQFKFWKKVKTVIKDDDPLKFAINEARRYRLNEVVYYDNLLNRYNSAEEIQAEFVNKNKEEIIRKAEQDRSKYKTYLQINPTLNTPTIYKNIRNKNELSMIAKIRLVSHNLQIELGRRNNTPRELRLCHCKEGVEDEEHFLIRCESYTDIRLKFMINRDTTVEKILNTDQYIQYVTELYKRRTFINS